MEQEQPQENGFEEAIQRRLGQMLDERLGEVERNLEAVLRGMERLAVQRHQDAIFHARLYMQTLLMLANQGLSTGGEREAECFQAIRETLLGADKWLTSSDQPLDYARTIFSLVNEMYRDVAKADLATFPEPEREDQG